MTNGMDYDVLSVRITVKPAYREGRDTTHKLCYVVEGFFSRLDSDGNPTPPDFERRVCNTKAAVCRVIKDGLP